MSVRSGVLVVAMAIALPLSGQESGSWPTLADLGASWITADGGVQFDLSGRGELEYLVPASAPPGLIPTDEAFLAGRLRLFGDLFLGDRVYGSAELRLDRGEEPRPGDLDVRLEQAFVRVRPTDSDALHLQLGKMPSLFGGYAARHGSVLDPFIRPPLMHDYRTVMPSLSVPGDTDGFLAWRDDPTQHRPGGSPVVWGVPYQWTAAALFGIGRVGLRAGVTNSSPGSPPEAWQWDSAGPGEAFVAGVTVDASSSLMLGASWSRGPYLHPGIEGHPDATPFEAWDQEVQGVEFSWLRGPAMIRGEFVRDLWEVPGVPGERAEDLSWYLEAQVDLSPGVWIAGRYNGLHFRPLDDREPWDHDVLRSQLGAGYRLARNAEVRFEWGHTSTSGPVDPADDLLSLQVWWAF